MSSFSIVSIEYVNNEHVPQFCRACACKLKKSYSEIENNPEKPELSLLLKRYVPEFDVKVANATLCEECVSILYIFHNFKRKCLRTEEDLRLHIRQNPEIKTVDINAVFDLENPANARKVRHKCEVCAAEFIEKSVLIGHMKLKHRERHSDTVNKPKLNCKLCKRSFAYKKSIRNHMEYYHGRVRYQCNKCSRDFIFKNRYQEHLEYHKRPDSRRFLCKICNFVYHSYSSLDKHNIAKHRSEAQRPFGCKICGRRFVEKSTLNDHMRTHTGDRPYKCRLCPYAATRKNPLKKHFLRMHRDTDIIEVD